MDKSFLEFILKEVKNSNIKHLKLSSDSFSLEIETFSFESAPSSSQSFNEPRIFFEEKKEIIDQKNEFENYHVIKSPLVGTFYRSPSPNAPPFVEVGDRVSIGQTLCIIEALKVMNEIESDVNGIVKKILIGNGEVVEYGQPLFLIDTNA